MKNLIVTYHQFAIYQGKRFGNPVNTIQYSLEFKKQTSHLVEFEKGFSVTIDQYEKLLNGIELELSPIPHYSTILKLS
jgi:hypothetical protein